MGSQNISNHQLETELRSLVQEERRITNRILVLINLAEERRLFLERGFSSTLDWLVKSYGYSERAAFRRISAARLLKAVPEASAKLETGQVNLTTLSQVQTAIRAHEKITGVKVDSANKAEIIQNIENKTSRETEKEIFSYFPAVASSVRHDRVTPIDEEHSRLSVSLNQDTLSDLKRVKDLLSHVLPNANWCEVIGHLAKDFINRRDPLKKRSATPPSAPNPEQSAPSGKTQGASGKHAQGISTHIRRYVLQRANGRCEFKDPCSGRICNSHYQIEIDHIKPRAIGGGDELENLRALCRRHNQFMAAKNLGVVKANQWRLIR